MIPCRVRKYLIDEAAQGSEQARWIYIVEYDGTFALAMRCQKCRF